MLKSEKRSNSPNKTSDDCYSMKFDLSDNQLLHKKELVAHFNRWANIGVAWKHAANAAFQLFKSIHTEKSLFFNYVNKNAYLKLVDKM